MIASCRAVLDVWRQPNVWSPYLSNVVPHMHFWVWLMMGSCSLHCRSSVNDSLFSPFEGSLLGRLCSAMLASGLNKLGRKMLLSFGINGICVISSLASGHGLVEMSLCLRSGDVCLWCLCFISRDCFVDDVCYHFNMFPRIVGYYGCC
jgi:hypothetical protein